MERESLRRARGQFINVSRYQGKVRAMFGIDGENPVPSLSELLPVVVVENDRFETRLPGNEFSFIGGGSLLAGGAGFSSNVALLNPTGSGVLVTVEAVDAGSISVVGAVAESVITASYTQLAANVLPRDFRGFGPAASVWSRNNAVPPTERARLHSTYNPVEFCLAPGQALVIWGATLNAGFDCAYVWRERAAEQATR